MPNTTTVKAEATQAFVPIKEVRDGIVILKDGSMRVLLMASSINLALKSQDEQQAIVAQFQNFLNSLEFTVQFFVQSRELDIRPYIALLEDRYNKELDDLMRTQIREYIAFIKDFTERADIMSKNFFIVVPYDPACLTIRPLVRAAAASRARWRIYSRPAPAGAHPSATRILSAIARSSSSAPPLSSRVSCAPACASPNWGRRR
jgi:hypothetical protein